ncbi:Aste57867_6727 [Aphanomyces stellatus]|uniref:Aste57867_6727 protein n=1 Tax=Aphanomyces stellatus TaxID=120398 RepID=A0A485KEI1_9STRA|nr:hypothetical protein As57867_006707 [Aphanomyces stellatus]VFT83695.1 Aste57867_6727 [Aphanomyces stellatus]
MYVSINPPVRRVVSLPVPWSNRSASTRPQALTLALLKINKLSHLLTSCQRVWPASILYEHINAACVRQNLEPPTKQWISILVTKLSASFPIVPAEEAPPFKLPTTSEVWRRVPWMIRPDQEPILLTTATSKSAKFKTPPSTDLPFIPTWLLNVPSIVIQSQTRQAIFDLDDS